MRNIALQLITYASRQYTTLKLLRKNLRQSRRRAVAILHLETNAAHTWTTIVTAIELVTQTIVTAIKLNWVLAVNNRSLSQML